MAFWLWWGEESADEYSGKLYEICSSISKQKCCFKLFNPTLAAAAPSKALAVRNRIFREFFTRIGEFIMLRLSHAPGWGSKSLDWVWVNQTGHSGVM